MGMSFVNNCKKIYGITTAPHCIMMMTWQYMNENVQNWKVWDISAWLLKICYFANWLFTSSVKPFTAVRKLEIARPGGRFKNTHELLNLGVPKMLCLYRILSFNVWARYHVWNFKGTLWNSTHNIFPIHWKICILYSDEILTALRFISSWVFLKHSPDATVRFVWGKWLGRPHALTFVMLNLFQEI